MLVVKLRPLVHRMMKLQVAMKALMVSTVMSSELGFGNEMIVDDETEMLAVAVVVERMMIVMRIGTMVPRVLEVELRLSGMARASISRIG